MLLRLPAADGGLLQGVLHENGGALPRGSFAAVATLPTGLGRSVNNHHICAADLSAVGSVAETAVEAIQGKEVESREERVFEANEGDGVDLLEMLYTE